MTSNGYQDISALLRSLTSYTSGSFQPEAQHRNEITNLDSLPQVQQNTFYAETQAIAQPELLNYYSENQAFDTRHGFAAQHTPYPQSLVPGQASADDPEEPKQQTPAGSAAFHSSKSGPDPRTITAWPAALRYVTNLLAQNATISETIKKMIENQHENERAWWAGRQALLRQQAARVNGQKQLDDVLRSVGAQPSSGPDTTDPVAELKRHDAKVHAAATKMVEAMSADLEALGIPFFGLGDDMVSDDSVSQGQREPVAEGHGASSNKKICRKDLAELQKRMLGFLEEYCKE